MTRVPTRRRNGDGLMMNRNYTNLAFCLSAFASLLTASAQTFEPVASFPSPAPGSFTVVGTGLHDGRFVLWNGNQVYVQIDEGSVFIPVASGYTGDPAFAALSPDGATLILGGGFTPKFYRLHVDAWQNHAPTTEIDVPTHFSGVFLSDNLVALDCGIGFGEGAEIVVVDISGAKSGAQPRAVLALPTPKGIIDKPPFAFSSQIAVDDSFQTFYVMDSNTRELRSFAVADIINAYNTDGTLDWSTDGTLIGAPGTYYNGGPAGINAAGDLVIGGAEGFGMPGGIQIVDPVTGAVEATLDPTGTQQYVSVIFNPATDAMIALDGFALQAYATSGSVGSLPASSPAILLVLLATIAFTALRRVSTCKN